MTDQLIVAVFQFALQAILVTLASRLLPIVLGVAVYAGR